jgi:hypothetical protein
VKSHGKIERHFNAKRGERKMREKEKAVVSERQCISMGMVAKHFPALKVPRHCSLVLLVDLCLRGASDMLLI